MARFTMAFFWLWPAGGIEVVNDYPVNAGNESLNALSIGISQQHDTRDRHRPAQPLSH